MGDLTKFFVSEREFLVFPHCENTYINSLFATSSIGRACCIYRRIGNAHDRSSAATAACIRLNFTVDHDLSTGFICASNKIKSNIQFTENVQYRSNDQTF